MSDLFVWYGIDGIGLDKGVQLMSWHTGGQRDRGDDGAGWSLRTRAFEYGFSEHVWQRSTALGLA